MLNISLTTNKPVSDALTNYITQKSLTVDELATLGLFLGEYDNTPENSTLAKLQPINSNILMSYGIITITRPSVIITDIKDDEDEDEDADEEDERNFNINLFIIYVDNNKLTMDTVAAEYDINEDRFNYIDETDHDKYDQYMDEVMDVINEILLEV